MKTAPQQGQFLIIALLAFFWLADGLEWWLAEGCNVPPNFVYTLGYSYVSNEVIFFFWGWCFVGLASALLERPYWSFALAQVFLWGVFLSDVVAWVEYGYYIVRYSFVQQIGLLYVVGGLLLWRSGRLLCGMWGYLEE